MIVRDAETVVIGTGCAGYNAADCLYDLGKKDTVILTEGIRMGTSRNTGSDKQTYYKLSVAGDQQDSVEEMANTLFAGNGVMGDIALCEAAGSLQGFFKLAGLGVPFPTNAYGEYCGYKTDHDPRMRATSAGPLTSRYMTEALESAVRSKNIPVIDHMQVVRLLVQDRHVYGLLAMDTQTGELACYRCQNIIAATGGPAIVYHASVYPESQAGMTGTLLQAGTEGRNLNEWQYGLASLAFRWNVSGTYQQVLPRYIAVDENGIERELFQDYFSDPYNAVNNVFLKGYQWPFDIRKAEGSSMLDLIVHHATCHLGLRVYMDFTRNPSCVDQAGFEPLADETKQYLKNSNALFGTPIDRLRHMNPGAIQLYLDHGIDLEREPLEVAVCAQHMNGGIAVDRNWETSVKGLYVCGEAAGTFGTYRPGGSALNTTQVGSRRAAEAIAYRAATPPLSAKAFQRLAQEAVAALPSPAIGERSNLEEHITRMQRRMSVSAAYVRDRKDMCEIMAALRLLLHEDQVTLRDRGELPRYYHYRDMLSTQLAMLSAMLASARDCGSVGSALVLDAQGKAPAKPLESYRMAPQREQSVNSALITRLNGGSADSAWVPVTPIPERDEWFENVWRQYRERTGR
jgi:succinate dehydrogenase/fumarate reductase flavoprotein subunit